ncbi:hypothetical protein EON62_01910 [archaeon]|nr:MAG: hypothetical protein EON62_01910 [archaeon]
MSLVPEDEDGPWAGEDMRTALLATIRVPHMFGMGGRPAGLNLPVCAACAQGQGGSCTTPARTIRETL